MITARTMLSHDFEKKVHNLLREIVSDLLVIISIESSLRKMSVFGYETTVGYETTDRPPPSEHSKYCESIDARRSRDVKY